MFLYTISPGQVRLALIIFRAEKQSEIIVFLSAQDDPVTDVNGELTRTPRLYVDSKLLPKAAGLPVSAEPEQPPPCRQCARDAMSHHTRRK